MNADERKALNKAIAGKLGWRVERDERAISGQPVSFWSLYAPNGERARSTIMSSTFGRDQLWRDIPDFCGSLDATVAALGSLITLPLVVIEEVSGKQFTSGTDTAATVQEAAALALDAWLTGRAEGEEK